MRSLVLDLGNSTLAAGLFDGPAAGRGRPTPPAALRRKTSWARSAISASPPAAAGRGDHARHGDALAAKLRRFARGRVDRIALASVVPAATAALIAAARTAFGVEPEVLSATADHGLRIGYRQPARLGADRVAAVLGAQALHPRRNLIVVDCGTATTLTVLRRDGALLGGAILPGLGLWAAMLAQRTAQLPEIELRAPRTAVGRDPAAALRSGIVFGHAGAIRELVARLGAEAFGRGRVAVVGTGGMVTRLKGQSLFTAVEPALTLHGLQSFLLRQNRHD